MVYMMDNIRERIMTSATNLIFSHGPKGWNMNDCAADAGITKRTLYKYANSKEELITGVLLETIRNVQDELSAKLDSSDDPEQGLYIILEYFPALILKLNVKSIRLIFRDYPGVKRVIYERKAELTEEVTVYMERCRQNGILKPDIDIMETIEIIQAVVIYYISNTPDDMHSRIRSALDTVLNGILND